MRYISRWYVDSTEPGSGGSAGRSYDVSRDDMSGSKSPTSMVLPGDVEGPDHD